MKIWFNHWFSAVYNIILMIKKEFPQVTIVGSNRNELAVYNKVCDEWYSEPLQEDKDEYVKFCLDFCKEHKIDIFVPYEHLVDVVNYKDEFTKIGVKLFVNQNIEFNNIIDDKVKTYQYLYQYIPDIIPDYYIAKSYEEFEKAYQDLVEKGYRVCYKLTIDHGARSFRVIDNSIEDLKAIYEKPGTKVKFETSKKILSQYDFNIPMLVMPYLDGEEVSIDCIKLKTKNIIIPRFKFKKRFHDIRHDEEMIRISNIILDHIDCDMPVNIQIKMLHDKPYLLEINPRMSGGIQLSCLASNINIPAIALKKLLGEDIDETSICLREGKVAHVEYPIKVE